MKKIALRLTTLLVGMLCVLSCDQDPTTIGQDLIGVDPNDIIKETEFEVTAYSQRLDAVQTGRQIVSTADRPHVLGIYDDPIYGRTEYSFVSQLSLPFAGLDFGSHDTDTDMTNPVPAPLIERVSIEIPYYSTITGIDGESREFELDSLFNGDVTYKVEIFRNNYFINSLNPNNLDEDQVYFNDEKSLVENSLDPTPIYSNSSFKPDNLEVEVLDRDFEVEQRKTPRFIISEQSDISCIAGCEDPNVQDQYVLNSPYTELIQYFQDTILNQEGSSVLASDSNFQNYFRGLYFKVTPSGAGGNAIYVNLADAHVNLQVLVSNRDTSDLDGDGDVNEINTISSAFRFDFSPRSVQFIDQEIPVNIENEITSNSNNNGAERLFLKGGPGSAAIIKLFPSDSEFDAFLENNWLINDAYLDFYVDQSRFTGINGEIEPERILVYNARNGEILADYNFTSSNVSALNSNTVHLGRLERETEDDLSSRGVKYRIRLTNHLNSLLNSTNPINDPIAVVVSQNVNVITGQRIKDATDSIELENVPLSTVIAPEGTVLHGNLSTDPDKRLQLKVFYTETN